MDYSIVIPVFNKAALTRHCLATLRPTLEGAGQGEVIVIDNASSDETPEMLLEFPWVHVVRNEVNRGFSGANNQGAEIARGRFLVLLNNDTEGHPGWLASMLTIARNPDVGAVGARLLFPDGTLQHAGVAIDALEIGTAAFTAFHDMYRLPGAYEPAWRVADTQVVSGACLVTPRDLYRSLGGLDESFWNGYEDIDYCLKIRSQGLRVVYDGEAVLTHFESQSGPQRFRRVSANVDLLATRWNGQVAYDAQRLQVSRGSVRRRVRSARGASLVQRRAIPRITIIYHGTDAPSGRQRRHIEKTLRANVAPIERITYVGSVDLTSARAAMELRGDRYVVFVDARCTLQAGWLDELVRQVEFSVNTGAAAYVPELSAGEDVAAVTADARCTLLALRKYPQHLRLETFPAIGGALADFLIRGMYAGVGVRVCAAQLAQLPPMSADEEFERRHGVALQDAISSDPADVESMLRKRAPHERGLVSIIMLSWNAPEYTKLALESIRRYTRGDYEVIIVDNGSAAETVEWLRTIQDVRVVFNGTNKGYAGGNNVGIAHARGGHIVLLNNDVIVTEGWLEGLLRPFARIPGLGVSAPRSNIVAGDQVTTDSVYADVAQMHAYAQKRRERYRGEGYVTDRAIGLCLCIDRRVIDEVGGIDERFGAGNFEDDDFCIRVRAAGYKIFVCDDVFIHHFGSKSFAANNVDWQSTMHENWGKFARKWGYAEHAFNGSYQPEQAIAGGFDRTRHYVPLPLEDVK